MIFYVLFIIFTFSLVYVNNVVAKKILYPPLYLSFIWIFVILVHLGYVYFSNYKPNVLSFRVLIYLFTTIVVFSFGGIIAKLSSNHKNKKDVKIRFPNKILNIMTITSFLFLVFFLMKIKEVTGSYFNLLAFRYYTSIERVDIGFVKYGIVISIFITIIVFIDFLNRKNKSRIDKIRLLFVFFSCLSLAYLSASRGTVLLLLISCLGAYSIYNTIKVKLLLRSFLITVSIFVLMATLMKKSMPNEHFSKIQYSVMDRVEFFFYGYLTLPVSALDKHLSEKNDMLYGETLFRFPKAVLFKTGLIERPPKKLVEHYVKVPDLVNVHTAYYKLIKDFGVLYSLVVMFIVGFVHSRFYFYAKKSYSGAIGFVFLLFPLTMIFFEENYFSIMSTWFQFVLLTYITKKFLIKTSDE